jgi:hypothetical protein
MHPKDVKASFDIWQIDGHAAIETAWTDQCRVEYVRTVCGSNDDDTRVALEAIHLREDLVQRLLALVVAATAHTATAASCTLTADRIDLVNEDDARRILLCLIEKVTNS